MLRWFIGAIVCVALAAAAVAVQRAQIHPRLDLGMDEDLLYLPNEKLLNHFTGGLSGVLADLLWIQTINYASQEFNSVEKKFTWLEHMIRTVTRLDPYYEDAYINGGMMLAALGQDAQALHLLQQGLVARPDSAGIARELVNIYLLNRRREPGAPALTLHYMSVLARNSKTPDFYINLMDRIRTHGSLEGEARRVWTNLLESAEDEFVRELAQAQLAALDAELVVDALNAALDRFRQRYGRAPQSLDDLLASQGDHVPDLASFHGDFYLAPDDTVRSTLLDARIADQYKRKLLGRLRAYNSHYGSYPPTLANLEEEFPEVSLDHPVPGFEWRYDPETGDLTDAPAEGANQ